MKIFYKQFTLPLVLAINPNTSYLISKGYLPGALKSYAGTPYFPLMVKITLPPLTNHLLIFFAGRMLTHVIKKEIGEIAKRMRASAIMPKDFLAQKQKVPATTTQAPTEQDKETTSGLLFKRKKKAIVAPTEHSHSDGRAPYQHVAPSEGQASPLYVIVIQEGEAKSSRGKSLWDPSFDVPTHGEHTFLPSNDKDKLMAHDEDQLYHDTMKKIG